jgi:hypothetical protein
MQPGPGYGISVGVAKKDKRKHWDSLIGLKQAKASSVIQDPPDSKTKELIKLKRNQLRWVVDTVT